MRGICFKEPLFRAIVDDRKTVTRRTMDLYNVGEILFLKEPYRLEENNVIRYKYSSVFPEREKWRNKLFMKADYARYHIKIINKRQERLQDITPEDCEKEGIMEEIPEAWGMSKDDPHYWVCPDEISMVWFETPQKAFASLIDKINGVGTWESNPIVTRYEFELFDF